jgi:hypothetical protein
MACCAVITLIVIVDQRLPVRLAVHLPTMVELELFPEIEPLHLYVVSRPLLRGHHREPYHLLIHALITLLPADVGLPCLQICPNEAEFVNVDIDR